MAAERAEWQAKLDAALRQAREAEARANASPDAPPPPPLDTSATEELEAQLAKLHALHLEQTRAMQAMQADFEARLAAAGSSHSLDEGVLQLPERVRQIEAQAPRPGPLVAVLQAVGELMGPRLSDALAEAVEAAQREQAHELAEAGRSNNTLDDAVRARRARPSGSHSHRLPSHSPPRPSPPPLIHRCAWRGSTFGRSPSARPSRGMRCSRRCACITTRRASAWRR